MLCRFSMPAPRAPVFDSSHGPRFAANRLDESPIASFFVYITVIRSAANRGLLSN